jgi:cold shock CspA family protein
MARSKETFNKRAKEQKRLKERQDKREKMEERKLTKKKGMGLEDMMAYVDDNGNITDKPQDPRLKKVFRAEDILIAIPKGNERESTRTGKLQFFDNEKGFGFIIDDISHDRVFLHHSNLDFAVELNDSLRFDVQPGERGPVAVHVSKIE